MQALSEKLQDESKREFLLKNYRPEINFLNVDYMPDTLLAGNLAERALDLFRKYGDVYQSRCMAHIVGGILQGGRQQVGAYLFE